MKNTLKFSGFFITILFMSALSNRLYARPSRVIIGYVGGFRGLINTSDIKARQLTHINYAFVDIKANRAWLHREATDTINFRHLVALKKENPALKILISIGGWAWSSKFSDAVLTDTARRGFAASAVAIIKKFNLDGIDIDWEYPGRPGLEGNIYRDEDQKNYTLMFKELRSQLDELQKETGKKYLLTTAAGAFKGFLDHTDMGTVQQYLDYVNLMTYDYSGGRIASHHTALFSSNAYDAHNNADDAVTLFEAAGVPADKLVMGIAFYGRSATLRAGAKVLGDSVSTRGRGFGYTIIKDSILKVADNKLYRDKHAKADYIYNASTRMFITFDDEYSVKRKCRYIKKKKMAGVMFWEYVDDLNGYLLTEINKDLH